MKVRISSLFIFSICAFWLTAAVFAGAPARISYQGTLRKSDAVYTGSVPMEFRITDKTGSAVYWTSNSTDVYVSAGLFRYTLGTPNETQFQNVDWKSVTPYLEVIIEGNALPGEPLYSSPYSLYSDSAGGARGDFSVQDGNIAISTTAGNKGIIFQDKTVQYTAVQPVWSVYGANLYVLPAGGAGIGTNSPAARLDVKAGGSGASDMAQIWRNSADIIVSSVSATGVLKAARFVGDGSGLTGVSAGIAGVVSDNAQFSGDGAGTGTMLTLKSSSATLQGNSFNGPGQLVRLAGSGYLPALDGSALTNITAGQAGLGNVTNDAQLKASALDTDAALAANSDGKVASQKAVKTYADTKLPSSARGAVNGVAALDASALVPAAQIPPLSASKITSGKFYDSMMSVSTGAFPGGFNGAGQLVQMTVGSKLPAVDGSLLTAVTASAIAADAVASANIVNGTIVTVDIGDSQITDAKIAGMSASKLSGALPAMDGSALTGLTKSQVGLGNVTNDAQLKASDLDTDGALAANSDSKVASQKAVKTYVAAGLGGKEAAIAAGAAGQYYRGDKTWATLDKSAVSLGSVTNDAQLKASDLDTDGALAANSDSKVASQKAVKTYVAAGLGGKEAAIAAGAAGQYYRGDKTWAALDAAAVAGGTFQNSAYTFQNSVNFPGMGIWNASGNVGIGTASPGTKLDVAGTVNATDFTKNGIAVPTVPSGMIAFFPGACPSGWAEYTALRGRLIIGTPLSGTDAGTVGTALGNLSPRTITDVPAHFHSIDPPATVSGTESADHTHAVDPPNTGVNISDPGHSHSVSTGWGSGMTSWGAANMQESPAGSIGTSASGTGITASVDIGSFSSGGRSATHTHTTDIAAFNSASAGSASVDVTMPYIQLRACQAP